MTKKLDDFHRMYRTLRLIDVEPYELSHEKIVQQRDWFKKLARETLQEMFNDDKDDKDEADIMDDVEYPYTHHHKR